MAHPQSGSSSTVSRSNLIVGVNIRNRDQTTKLRITSPTILVFLNVGATGYFHLTESFGLTD